MQIKTYTDAESFVAVLQESQKLGQRVRLGKHEGTLEVFEAPSRTFGRGVEGQNEVDQSIIQEQEALGKKLNELLQVRSFATSSHASLQRNSSQWISTAQEPAPPSPAQVKEVLLAGIQQTLSALQDLQIKSPGNAAVALPTRLLQTQALLEQPTADPEMSVSRAISLLNSEVSSLRIMLNSASDPAHPIGHFFRRT